MRIWLLMVLLLIACDPKRKSPQHAHISDCAACHVKVPSTDSTLCLSCHAPLAETIKLKRGLHSWATQQKLRCADPRCHLEHSPRGRPSSAAFRSGGLWQSEEAFRGAHDQRTLFPLQGAHAKAPCAGCHTRSDEVGQRLFTAAPLTCAGCHQSPHGLLPEPLKDCRACHGLSSFRLLPEPRFDHQKHTRHPLEGAHRGAACGACHGQPPRFRVEGERGGDCASCHRKSPHGGSFGGAPCRSCHRADAPWRQSTFKPSDHGERSGFVLSGGHQRPCASCHLPTGSAIPGPECGGCHQKDSPHKAELARFTQCATCHLAGAGWTAQAFKHGPCFPLTANHATSDLRECSGCHKSGALDDRRGLRLASCGPKDPFAVRCVGCHTDTHQSDPRRRQTPCLTCHETPGSEKMRTCLDARGKVEPRCEAKLSAIGHGPGAAFPLQGGHALSAISKRRAGDSCRACHRVAAAPFAKLPTACVSCHLGRDVHAASLGSACQRCHSASAPSFRAPLFNHQTMTSYPLVGAHQARATCKGCHPTPTRYKGTTRQCGDAACHAKDDVHRGNNSSQCADDKRCHGQAHHPEHGSWWHLAVLRAKKEGK